MEKQVQDVNLSKELLHRVNKSPQATQSQDYFEKSVIPSLFIGSKPGPDVHGKYLYCRLLESFRYNLSTINEEQIKCVSKNISDYNSVRLCLFLGLESSIWVTYPICTAVFIKLLNWCTQLRGCKHFKHLVFSKNDKIALILNCKKVLTNQRGEVF